MQERLRALKHFWSGCHRLSDMLSSLTCCHHRHVRGVRRRRVHTIAGTVLTKLQLSTTAISCSLALAQTSLTSLVANCTHPGYVNPVVGKLTVRTVGVWSTCWSTCGDVQTGLLTLTSTMDVGARQRFDAWDSPSCNILYILIVVS